MQKSHTSFGVDLHKIAKASNFKHSFSVKSDHDLNNLLDYLPPIDGPIFANIKVEPQLPPRSLPILDGVELKNRFRKNLNLNPL